MAMSVGAEGDGDEKPMSEINTTPLVDIMLVMLIIFLITVPVVVQAIDLELPPTRFDPTTTKPENVSLSVRARPGDPNSCQVFWNLTPVDSDDLRNRAVEKLKLEIDKQGGPDAPGIELPEAHIRADVNAPWMCVAGAIFNMQLAGFQRVGFISEPPAGGTVRL
jgi:biopolymer transport protein ExbD